MEATAGTGGPIKLSALARGDARISAPKSSLLDGQDLRRMSWLDQGSRGAALQGRGRCGAEHAMADDGQRPCQGFVGVQAVKHLFLVAAFLMASSSAARADDAADCSY